MKTIKLLLCVLLTAMSFNVFADEVGRYQMLLLKPTLLTNVMEFLF